jgi:hypothetical protein
LTAYDCAQGAQTLIYSEWYRGNSGLSANQGFPIYADLRNLAPIYVQADGKEILLYDSVILPKPPDGNRST